MQQPVQDEDLDFSGERVALPSGLAQGGGNADGKVACNFLWTVRGCVRWKRKHVCGFVLATKAAIQIADCGVGSQQDGDLTAEPDRGLRSGEKATQGAGGGQVEIGLFCLCPRLNCPLHRLWERRGVWVQIWVEKDHCARGLCLRGSGLHLRVCLDDTQIRALPLPRTRHPPTIGPRSEERRVGKECRSRWSPY